MSDVLSPTIENNNFPKLERGLDDIQKGFEKIEAQIRNAQAIKKDHLIKEQQEREGLDESLEQAFRELDNSAVGQFYKKASGGTTLSEAKQTWWGTIGANTLQGGQALANIVIHPIQTTKAVGQFARHPIDSTKQVASIYKDEWNYSNGWGKVGVAWRGSFEVVFGAKGAGTVSKVAKIGYQAGKLGKLGTVVQKGVDTLGATGTVISEATPEIVTKTLGGMSAVASKVSEKIPQKVKTFGTEQSRIGMIDDPLDNLTLNKQGLKTEKTASFTGEMEVFGEKIVQPKIWTRADKIAVKPKNIEVHRWNILVKSYPNYSPEQLGKAFKIENFLVNYGIKKEHLINILKSSNIDTIKIVNSSSENIIAYRFYGGNSSQYSYYYTPKDLRFIPEHEISDFLALPDGNSIERVSQVVIPKGSPLLIGKIATQKVNGIEFLTKKLGGSQQIYYPFKDKNVKILSDYNLKQLQNGN